MSKTPTDKVMESLVNLIEQAYFNPAQVGRYLSEQPYYTTDRTMEMIAEIITHIARRAKQEEVAGKTSDGLYLANELACALEAIKETYQFKTLKLPRSLSEISAGLPKVELKDINRNYRYSWLDNNNEPDTVRIEHPFFQPMYHKLDPHPQGVDFFCDQNVWACGQKFPFTKS